MQRVVAIRTSAQAQAAEPRVNPELGCGRNAVAPNFAGVGRRGQGAPSEHHLPKRAREPKEYRRRDPNCGIAQRRGASNLPWDLELSLIHISEPTRLLSIS